MNDIEADYSAIYNNRQKIMNARLDLSSPTKKEDYHMLANSTNTYSTAITANSTRYNQSKIKLHETAFSR